MVCDIGGGVKAAFVSWTYGTNGIKTPAGKEWSVSYLSPAAISRDLARARTLSPDLVIAMAHLGVEYTQTPPESVTAAVEQMLACGADIVIAGHPHVLQKFEFIKTKGPDGKAKNAFVAWSMGNFISGQRTKPRDVGAILELTIEKTKDKTSVVSASVIPTWVQAHQSNGGGLYRVLPFREALREPGRWAMRASDSFRIMEAQRGFPKLLPDADAKPESAFLSYEIKPPR